MKVVASILELYPLLRIAPSARLSAWTVEAIMESPAAVLSRGLAEEVEAVCNHYLSNGRRCGNYWVVGEVNNHAGQASMCGSKARSPARARAANGAKLRPSSTAICSILSPRGRVTRH
ncbi:MAG: hypothetical protein AB7U61_02765 [Methylocystis sp.]